MSTDISGFAARFRLLPIIYIIKLQSIQVTIINVLEHSLQMLDGDLPTAEASHVRGYKGGRTGRAPPLFVGRNIFNTYHFCTGFEVRRYTPVWHTGTSLVGLKAYRHFFLGESHTGCLLYTSPSPRD